MSGSGEIRWRGDQLTALLAQVGIGERCTRTVTHLTVDSREVREGSVFVAIRGEQTDGHRHIEQAVRHGARVVICEPDAEGLPAPAEAPEVDFVAAPDTRRLSGRLAPLFYDHPARKLRVVGVTGTNGKTTCTCVLQRLLERAGHRVGVINSLGVHRRHQTRLLANILPEPVTLQRELHQMVAEGVDAAVLEVSSYALAVGRPDGVDFDAAVLTNVTQDHLDVHQTMERYLAAKLHLFDLLAASVKPERTAAVWRDTRFGDEIGAHVAPLPFATNRFAIGQGPEPDAGDDVLRAENLGFGWRGSTFDLVWRGRRIPGCRTALLGEFNVRNILAALATAPRWLEEAFAAGDEGGQRVRQTFDELRVPGRLEPVANDRGAMVLVDYAHTDDALRCVLETLAALPHGRLVVVLGCGGDRDRQKRPLMGSVASRYATKLVLTSDNPRTEDPRAIIDEIATGIPPGPGGYLVIEEREEAISTALSWVGAGDILLVAGKGHEEHQIVGTEVRRFDDREVIREHL